MRTLVADDPRQAAQARAVFTSAERIAFSSTMLCETAWVLRGTYGFSNAAVRVVMENVLATRNADIDRPAIEAGMAFLSAGGDFADGVIAYEGQALGGQVFVSFDRNATRLLQRRGLEAMLLRGA